MPERTLKRGFRLGFRQWEPRKPGVGPGLVSFCVEASLLNLPRIFLRWQQRNETVPNFGSPH